MIGAMAEEVAAGGVDTVAASTEIDFVEVQLEDLLLREFALDREAQDPFAELAAEGLLAGEEDIAGKLLGDRRAALRPVTGLCAHADRAEDADRIDAGMLVEAPVLDRDHRVFHHLRDLVRSQPLAITRPERDQHRA